MARNDSLNGDKHQQIRCSGDDKHIKHQQTRIRCSISGMFWRRSGWATSLFTKAVLLRWYGRMTWCFHTTGGLSCFTMAGGHRTVRRPISIHQWKPSPQHFLPGCFSPTGEVLRIEACSFCHLAIYIYCPPSLVVAVMGTHSDTLPWQAIWFIFLIVFCFFGSNWQMWHWLWEVHSPIRQHLFGRSVPWTHWNLKVHGHNIPVGDPVISCA